MSVVVLGMEKPKRCLACDFQCFFSDGSIYCKRLMRPIRFVHTPPPDWCPLRPLPEKHGRLIDADKLEGAGYALSRLCIDNDSQNPKQMIWRELIPFDEAPTVIAAEGGSDE